MGIRWWDGISEEVTFELKSQEFRGRQFQAQGSVRAEPPGSRELNAIREQKGQKGGQSLEPRERD